MTHEDLLSTINEDERMAHLYGYSGHQSLLKYFNSLRAVVELHKQIDDNSCHHCATWYPCPTIQAIEKELE